MVQYRYKARDQQGKEIQGVQQASDPSEVRVLLRRKHLYVVEVASKPIPSKTLPAGRPFSRKKIRLSDLVVMSRQLATLVTAGMPIVECLHSLAGQTENPLLAAVIRQVCEDVTGGVSLAESMKRHRKVFNDLFISLILAGETAGKLDEMLELAADQFEREADLREKISTAFVYPALVLAATVAVVAFLLIFVVPVFERIYAQFNVQLPFATQMLVRASDLIMHYTLPLAAAIVVAVQLLRRFIARPRGRLIYDRVKLRLPLLGKLNRKIAVTRFVRTWAAMIQAGVPILKSLAVAANTAGNIIVANAISQVAGSVQDGTRIWHPLEQSGEFPSMVCRMVAAGEESGSLDMMLRKLANYYDRDIQYTVDRLTRILEPIMTIVIGLIVLFVLIALYMPIYNLNQVVRR